MKYPPLSSERAAEIIVELKDEMPHIDPHAIAEMGEWERDAMLTMMWGVARDLKHLRERKQKANEGAKQ